MLVTAFRSQVALRRLLGDWGAAILLIALVNLPFWALELRYAVVRPAFNADTAMALLLAQVGGWWWVLALLAAWSLDLLQGLALGFHFGSVANFLETIRFLPQVSVAGLMDFKLLATVAVFAGSLGAAIWVRRKFRPTLFAVALMFVAITLADIFNGSGLPLLLKVDPSGSANLQGSPALNLMASTIGAQRSAGNGSHAVNDNRLSGELL
jgi:hypothetical protein